MESEDIEKMIKSHLSDADVKVTGDGRHFEAVVISTLFEGMSLIARQRYVYSALGDHIQNGNIHALTIKAKTPSEIKN